MESRTPPLSGPPPAPPDDVVYFDDGWAVEASVERGRNVRTLTARCGRSARVVLTLYGPGKLLGHDKPEATLKLRVRHPATGTPRTGLFVEVRPDRAFTFACLPPAAAAAYVAARGVGAVV